jgi:hypothetical protein
MSRRGAQMALVCFFLLVRFFLRRGMALVCLAVALALAFFKVLPAVTL